MQQILGSLGVLVDLPHLLFNFHWWQVQQVPHGLQGCVFCCFQNGCHGFILHPVELQQAGLSQGCETQTIVNDAEYHYHALIQQKQMTLFGALRRQAFSVDIPFLHMVRERSADVDPDVYEAVL